MVTVGVTPDDSSSPDTVCMDAGYPKVPVSQVGLEVASVHPLSVTHHYFIGGESELRVFHWSVITVSNTAVDGGPVVVHPAYPSGSGSVHAIGESRSQSAPVRRAFGMGLCLNQCALRIRENESTGSFAILSHTTPSWVLEGTRSEISPACSVTPFTLTRKVESPFTVCGHEERSPFRATADKTFTPSIREIDPPLRADEVRESSHALEHTWSCTGCVPHVELSQ